MSLTIWDQGTDFYDHAQLANNWVTVDGHDHTPGKGKQIGTAAIADAAVTTQKIADNAITGQKIPDGSITQTELANNSVGSAQIIDGSVGTNEILDGSVTAPKFDPDFLPIGTVIAWYRPNTGVNLPAGGWEVCDGRNWSSITNAWGVSTGTIPDLRNKFILGAALTNNGTGVTQNPDIGQVGAVTHTTDLTHSHTVASHFHTVSSHAHTINPDGAHYHYYGSDAGTLTPPTAPTIPIQQSIANRGNDNYQTASPIAEAFAYKNHIHYGNTAQQADHSHGGTTAAASPTTDSKSPTTDSQLGTHDKRPAYVGLLYIMRVR